MSENTQAAPAAKAPAARFGGKGLNIGIAVAAIAGLALWGVQLSGGLVQTGMRNLDSWGLYITMFMFLVGLSAGGLIISSVPRAFGMKGFGGISKIAVWTSICCTVLAVGFVVIDLGQPLRLWELFAYSNLGSPLMWDIAVISIYLILSVVYLWAHEFWHTALLAPWFVSSALVCGVALVLVVVIALRKAGYLELDQANVVKLVKMLGAFVVVDLYFFGCDLLTAGFPGGSGSEIVAMLVSGPLAPFFWVEIVGCALCAAVCFAPKLRTNPLIVVASLLAIAGIFCKRVQLLVGGFQIPNLDYAGSMTQYTVTDWASGMTGAYQGMVYWPTPIEFGIVLGVVGLGALLLLLGLKYLPLKPVDHDR